MLHLDFVSQAGAWCAHAVDVSVKILAGVHTFMLFSVAMSCPDQLKEDTMLYTEHMTQIAVSTKYAGGRIAVSIPYLHSEPDRDTKKTRCVNHAG